MIALTRKEWRENRSLVFAFFVLAPVLSLLLKHFAVGWERTEPRHSIDAVLPVLLGLYLLALAADLVAGDTSSGRIGLAAALPVRPLTMWASKVVFLFGGGLVFAAYVGLVEWSIVEIADVTARKPFVFQDENLFGLGLAVLVGAGTLFYSTILDRGVAAALAGVLTIGAAAALLKVVDWRKLGFPGSLKELMFFLEVVMLVGFLLGSALAFTGGRIWLGSRLRRLAIGAATFLLVGFVSAGWLGAAVAAYNDVDPDDANLGIRIVGVDEAGERVRVSARHSGRGPLGMSLRNEPRWEVRLSDGVVRESYSLRGFTAARWTEAGGDHPLFVRFEGDEPFEGAVYAVPSDSGTPQPQHRGILRGRFRSPDGIHLLAIIDGRLRAFQMGRRDSVDLGPVELDLEDDADDGRTWLSQSAWTPDGRRFAFATGKTVYAGDLDTGTLRPVCPDPGEWTNAAWLDDDRILLDGRGLWIAALDGTLRQLLPR